MIGNLMDNACKWARTRVTVSSRAEIRRMRAMFCECCVDDDGPGLSPEAREKADQAWRVSTKTSPAPDSDCQSSPTCQTCMRGISGWRDRSAGADPGAPSAQSDKIVFLPTVQMKLSAGSRIGASKKDRISQISPRVVDREQIMTKGSRFGHERAMKVGAIVQKGIHLAHSRHLEPSRRELCESTKSRARSSALSPAPSLAISSARAPGAALPPLLALSSAGSWAARSAAGLDEADRRHAAAAEYYAHWKKRTSAAAAIGAARNPVIAAKLSITREYPP